MILKWNYAFIVKIFGHFEMYAQILIAQSSSVLKNIIHKFVGHPVE